VELVRVLITITITLWTAATFWYAVVAVWTSDDWLSGSMWAALVTFGISAAAWAMWYRRGMIVDR
jgi:hypothetical protein